MEYTDFTRDVIERTLKILDQYEQHVVQDEKVEDAEKYEVTLLINCLLGLLVLPKEQFESELPTKLLDECKEWGLSKDIVKSWGTYPKELRQDKPKHVREFVRRLRNSAAHCNFKVLGRDGKIHLIEFKDDHQFCAEFPVGNLHTFVTKLAEFLLANMPAEEAAGGAQ